GTVGNAPEDDPSLDRLGVHADLGGHLGDGEPGAGDAAAKSLVRHRTSRASRSDVSSLPRRPDKSCRAVFPSCPTILQWGIASDSLKEAIVKLPIDTSAIAFVCAMQAEPVVDFETRRPKADEN